MGPIIARRKDWIITKKTLQRKRLFGKKTLLSLHSHSHRFLYLLAQLTHVYVTWVATIYWIKGFISSPFCYPNFNYYVSNTLLPQIRSGSDFLLSSTGSFKRFDSVDRDCKQQEAVSSLWSNLPAAQIPGQPLRPAPSPPPSSISSAGSASTSKPHFFASHSLEQQQPHHPHPIKQQR